jgi:Asp-tRNA(Asn)/Glu-tRNA(Gln) amidotransferase A subunit family amidase
MQAVGRRTEFGDPGITKAKVGDADLVVVRDGAVINAFAVTGLPGRTVSANLVGSVPVGVQIVAVHYREDLWLRVGETTEAGGYASLSD